MTKTAMRALLSRIEDFYEKSEQVFLRADDEEAEPLGEFLATALDSERVKPKRPVHMPGYPESVCVFACLHVCLFVCFGVGQYKFFVLFLSSIKIKWVWLFTHFSHEDHTH